MAPRAEREGEAVREERMVRERGSRRAKQPVQLMQTNSSREADDMREKEREREGAARARRDGLLPVSTSHFS